VLCHSLADKAGRLRLGPYRLATSVDAGSDHRAVSLQATLKVELAVGVRDHTEGETPGEGGLEGGLLFGGLHPHASHGWGWSGLSLSFAAIKVAQLLYAAPSHCVCIISRTSPVLRPIKDAQFFYVQHRVTWCPWLSLTLGLQVTAGHASGGPTPGPGAELRSPKIPRGEYARPGPSLTYR
jgi:hypothetical protein